MVLMVVVLVVLVVVLLVVLLVLGMSLLTTTPLPNTRPISWLEETALTPFVPSTEPADWLEFCLILGELLGDRLVLAVAVAVAVSPDCGLSPDNVRSLPSLPLFERPIPPPFSIISPFTRSLAEQVFAEDVAQLDVTLPPPNIPGGLTFIFRLVADKLSVLAVASITLLLLLLLLLLLVFSVSKDNDDDKVEAVADCDGSGDCVDGGIMFTM